MHTHRELSYNKLLKHRSGQKTASTGRTKAAPVFEALSGTVSIRKNHSNPSLITKSQMHEATMRHNQNPSYTELLFYARKVARHIDEAEDLLQAILLAAVEAGRTDLSCNNNRRWLFGALRKRAAFDARTAVRRQQREASSTLTLTEESAEQPQADREEPSSEFIQTLPPSLRSAALLALAGHTKAEIAWLLRISDTALRQRIAQIKRRWRQFDGKHVAGLSNLKGELAFGQIRQALLQMARFSDMRTASAILASHDPDGHLFVVSSQNNLSRQRKGVPTNKEELRNV